MNEISVSGLVKIILCYSVVLFVSGVVKVEILLSVVDETLLYSARVSSYMTLLITVSLTFITIMFLLGLPWFVLQYIKSSLPLKTFLHASHYFIYALVANEILKIGLLFIFLKNEAKSITMDFDFQQQLTSTVWYQLNRTLDIAAIFISSFAFGWTIKIEADQNRSIDIVLSTGLIFAILFTFYMANT
ncbi:hypothetical protein [Chryseolinea lacunae]|uniref:Uncharacterized protein n=1 Tax=Chryseolinea lacunae TaxID=2801331 RepID=A0ABS1KWF5_9BACT|nr:hypothetical protein [Chryseolinea lacunae]MBL0742641.1 hypothetical protein [Chryseolinea lacunae]